MSRRPNVLVFVTHDTGRHLGCYGIREVCSPNIDRMAGQGVRFDRFFAAAAMCSPSRAAMFSGLHPQTNGVMGLVHAPWWWRYREDARHIAHYFRDAGYHTVAAGIVHEALDIMGTLGFDQHIAGNQASHLTRHVPEKLRSLAESEKPFYLQIGSFQTHSPYDADGAKPDSERGVYVPPHYVRNAESERRFADFQGSIRHADCAVGAILDALEETGLADNTIAVFTVDHGIAFPRSKATLYDPGIGTALVMRWPAGGVVGGRVCSHLLSNVDLTPTLLELAGVEVPNGLHGASFASVCRDEHAGPVRDAIFAEHTHPSVRPDTRCVRTDRWKMIRNFFPSRRILVPVDLTGRLKEGKGPRNTTKFVELYNLESDPMESYNLAKYAVHAETLRDLSRRLMQHMQAVSDPILDGPIRWSYYEHSLAKFRRESEEKRRLPEAASQAPA